MYSHGSYIILFHFENGRDLHMQYIDLDKYLDFYNQMTSLFFLKKKNTHFVFRPKLLDNMFPMRQ